jgi:hypothetical protein
MSSLTPEVSTQESMIAPLTTISDSILEPSSVALLPRKDRGSNRYLIS